MSIEFDRESLGKFDSRTLNRETLSRWTGCNVIIVIYDSTITHYEKYYYDRLYVMIPYITNITYYNIV